MATDLETRIALVEARNRKVEADKAWEGSFSRRMTIACVTYVIVLAYGYALGGERPYLNALVPTVGFLLSTVTVPVVKRAWITRRDQRINSKP